MGNLCLSNVTCVHAAHRRVGQPLLWRLADSALSTSVMVVHNEDRCTYANTERGHNALHLRRHETFKGQHNVGLESIAVVLGWWWEKKLRAAQLSCQDGDGKQHLPLDALPGDGALPSLS